MTRLGILVVFCACLLGVPAWAQGERQDLLESGRIEQGVEVDPVQVERGAIVYAEKCGVCHGLDLAGSTRRVPDRVKPEVVVPPLGMTGNLWRYPEPMLRNVVRLGELALVHRRSAATMPPHRFMLTETEVDSVIAFIKAHWTPEMRARQATIIERAAETKRRFDQGLPLLPDRRKPE